MHSQRPSPVRAAATSHACAPLLRATLSGAAASSAASRHLAPAGGGGGAQDPAEAGRQRTRAGAAPTICAGLGLRSAPTIRRASSLHACACPLVRAPRSSQYAMQTSRHAGNQANQASAFRRARTHATRPSLCFRLTPAATSSDSCRAGKPPGPKAHSSRRTDCHSSPAPRARTPRAPPPRPRAGRRPRACSAPAPGGRAAPAWGRANPQPALPHLHRVCARRSSGCRAHCMAILRQAACAWRGQACGFSTQYQCVWGRLCLRS